MRHQGRSGRKGIIPPAWAHCVINADPDSRLLFCALCERQYGFVYEGVRGRHGLAWYPILRENGIVWEPNRHYQESTLRLCGVRDYPELSISSGIGLYRQYETNPSSLQWVSEPGLMAELWTKFEPGADS